MDTWKLYLVKLASFFVTVNACFGVISIAAADADAAANATLAPPIISLGRVCEVAAGIYIPPIPYMLRSKAFL